MEYFFTRPEDIQGHSLILRGDESKHLARVLRKSVGDRIFVTDGNDTMYEAIIKEIGKNDARCDIAAIHRKYHEPAMDVTLAVSLLKNPARFDYLIEKATELGVRSIIPILCEHTIARSDKHERMEKIALASMKQCGRSWLPRIEHLQDFHILIGNSAHWPLRLIPHEKIDLSRSIKNELRLFTEAHSVLVVVGPEGGFSEVEIELAVQKGFHQVSLGNRRLRTETAAVAALAQLLI
jgi:16S rRNA (uracil1498-N3)-methyltransferase